MKNTKKKTIIIISATALLLAVGVVILGIGIGLFAAFHKPTLNMNKYVTIETDGYNGYGYVKYSVDTDKFMDDYTGKIKYTKQTDDAVRSGLYTNLLWFDLVVTDVNDEEAVADMFCEWFMGFGSITPSGYLSNGDVLTYSWNLEDTFHADEEDIRDLAKKFGVKIKYSDIEYTVSGLAEAPEFDPFEGVELSFTGMSPNGSVVISNYPDNGLEYQIDNGDNLANGDEVTVTVVAPYGMNDYINTYNKMPSITEKTYVVNNLPEYITSANQVPAEALKEMKAQAEDIISGNTYGWVEGYTLDVQYMGNYFMTAKQSDSSVQNQIYLVYKLHYDNTFTDYNKKDNEIGLDYYYYVKWTNMYEDAGGNFVYDLYSYTKADNEFKWNTGIYQSYNWIVGKTREVELTFEGIYSFEKLYDKIINGYVEKYKIEENV